MRQAALAAVLFSGVCFGQIGQAIQTNQTTATAKDIQHLRFVLLSIASIDHDPAAVQQLEKLLVKQFGLSAQDSAVIHAAGQSLKPLLAQNRQSVQAIVAGKTALSQDDLTALQSLDTQREQTLLDLANQILSSVSPAVAARLRAANGILGTATAPAR